MDGSVRVLLVSAGASPDALVAELERLGVEITPCSFVDAEEHLETDPPDLVALAGALGAVELANMIDDLDDGPRMVIVAERKELAKLRGLNREVVVSLFAMETTEKVVGQRIESLARRAARRRDHKGAEPAVVKKTSLGLPSAAQVGKLDLKKGEPPPRSRAPVVSEQSPPSSRNHPGRPLEPEKAPEPSPPEPVIPPQVPHQETEKQGIPGDVSPEKPGTPGEFAPSDKVTRPGAQKPPLPARTSPALSAKEEAERSIMVIDEDLLESILPDPPEGSIPEISILSMISIAPDPEDAPVSQPPTLPPAAKAQGSRVPAVKLAVAPGELDIADAEGALANIDSVKLEITQELVEHAHREMGSDKPALVEATDSKSEEVSGSEGAETPSGGEGQNSEDNAPPFTETSSLGMDQTIAFSDLKASFGEFGDDEPTKVADVDEERAALPSDEVREPVVSSTNASEALVSGDHVARAKGGGVRAFGIVALVLVALFGVYAAQSGLIGGNGQAKTPRAEPSEDAGSTAKAPTDREKEGKPAAHKADPEPPDAALPPPSTTSTAADSSAQQEIEQPSSEGTSKAEPVSHAVLDNPFKREDARAPTCEALLDGGIPPKGPDPVSEASAVWDKARAAIVSGKLKDAHLHMCEAVSINPESAAVEGLAAHYLSLGSYSEALRWAQKAEALRPGQKDIGNLMGDVYAMMGDVEKARDTWLRLLNIKPEERSRLAPISKDYSVEAGRHLRRGDLVRAEIFFRRAVILDRENLNGIIGLAKVYHRLEMPTYARAFCEESLKLSDVIPEVHVLLGELSLAEGNKEDARARFERALAVRPDFFPAKRGLSQVK